MPDDAPGLAGGRWSRREGPHLPLLQGQHPAPFISGVLTLSHSEVSWPLHESLPAAPGEGLDVAAQEQGQGEEGDWTWQPRNKGTGRQGLGREHRQPLKASRGPAMKTRAEQHSRTEYRETIAETRSQLRRRGDPVTKARNESGISQPISETSLRGSTRNNQV